MPLATKLPPVSQCRASVVFGVDPRMARRERPSGNPEIQEEMPKIFEKRHRFGYQRMGITLDGQGRGQE